MARCAIFPHMYMIAPPLTVWQKQRSAVVILKEFQKAGLGDHVATLADEQIDKDVPGTDRSIGSDMT